MDLEKIEWKKNQSNVYGRIVCPMADGRRRPRYTPGLGHKYNALLRGKENVYKTL